MKKICYTEYESPVAKLLIGSTENGICKISIIYEDETEEKFFKSLKKDFKGYEVIKVKNEDFKGMEEIKAYFEKKLKDFTLPLDIKGSDFQIKVWDILKTIPYGTTWTYKEVAQKAGNPKAARAVGAANRSNPIPVIIPCHRVIGSDGTMKGYGGKKCVPVKEFLLKLEKTDL